MRIAMTGADGLLGAAIAERYRAQGHEITRVTRATPASPHEVRWEPGAVSIAIANINRFTSGISALSRIGCDTRR